VGCSVVWVEVIMHPGPNPYRLAEILRKLTEMSCSYLKYLVKLIEFFFKKKMGTTSHYFFFA